MSEITSSISQVLRNINSNLTVDSELFDFPDLDMGCAISLDQIKSAKKTGGYFTVGASLLCECRVLNSVNGHDLIAVELSCDVLEQIESNTFNCSGKIPTDAIALPYGDDDNYTTWVVSWNQEFYVEKLNDPTPAA